METDSWKKIIVFVSSTFKDMDAERDALKFKVQPLLNERYKKDKIEIQFVDLRIGINTEGIDENTAESQILEICLSNIDDSRPYFIGLIGHRYGWIPATNRWETILNRLSREKRILLTNGEGKSVTELEILYGAIGNNGENLNHSMFFFRDENSYERIPKTLLSLYNDSYNPNEIDKGNLCEKLLMLKQRIIDVAKERNMESLCSFYSVSWNPATCTFEGMEQFVEMVYQKMCVEIDSDIATNNKLDTWLDEESLNTTYLLHKNTDCKIVSHNYYKMLQLKGYRKHLCIIGKQGRGKSVLLSQLFTYYSKDNENFCLLSFVGSSTFSQSINQILYKWVIEMNVYLGNSVEIDYQDNFFIIKELFQKAVEQINKRNVKVYVFLDGVDNFQGQQSQSAFLTWLTPNFHFIGTCTSKIYDKVSFYNNEMCKYDMELFNFEDCSLLIQGFEKYYNIQLPSIIKSQVLLEEGVSPLRLSLIMLLIGNFSSKNIVEIHQKKCGTEIEKINSYLLQIYQNSPTDEHELFNYVILKLIEQLSLPSSYYDVLKYIVYSKIGLREMDIQYLFDDKFNVLSFKTLMFILKDFIFEHPYSHRIYFREDFFSESIKTTTDDIHEIYRCLFNLINHYDENDIQRQQMYPYYAILSNSTEESIDILSKRGDRDYFIDLYQGSKFFILNDDFFLNALYEYCKLLTTEESKIELVCGLIDGVDFVENPQFCIECVDNLLSNIELNSLSIYCLYKMGWIFSCCGRSFTSVYNHLGKQLMFLNSKDFYYDMAEEAYRSCYDIAPDYKDCRNMLKAIMLNNLDRLVSTADWNEIEKYYSCINKL